jgi:D-alanyl-D-alanine carboxypeptidase
MMKPAHGVLVAALMLAGGPLSAQTGIGTDTTKGPPHPTNLAELRTWLAQRASADEFSGVVQIAHDSTVLFQEAYGEASRSLGVPNKVDTKFNLGSVNKLITMIAVLQLQEQHLLSLDDPLGRYLDIFPPEIADKVTISQLLSMQSGWGDYWDNPYFKAHRGEMRAVSDYMAFIKDIPLDFEPGTDTEHSNIGFEVAGAIIEKVSGMDYYEYVRKHIYEPAGMHDTDSFNADSVVANMAIGYTNVMPFDTAATGYRWTNANLMPPRGTPAGGGYSTAPDLLKFILALQHNRLLSPDYTRYFFNGLTGKLGDPILPLFFKGVWRSVGGAWGLSAVVGIDLGGGYSYVILSNFDFPVAMDVFQAIYRIKP